MAKAGLMDILRTPDSAFENLPDFPFQPHYLNVPNPDGGELRVHFLDEGPQDAPVILMLHGEPSWCYLYRKMIGPCVDAGYRVVAPDLVGFGRSDKLADRTAYTYQRHLDWLTATVEQLGLKDITLMCQDWGGLLGLRMVAEHPDWFARVCAANTFLPTGDKPAGEAFMKWKAFSQEVPEFPAGGIIKGGTTTPLSEQVIAAYNAPFPEEKYKEGARQFPTLVPVTPDNPASAANRNAWETLKQFDKPFLTAFSDSDPITAGGDKLFQALVPGCTGQAHVTIENGGHFLQEDQGEALAQALITFIRANS